MVISSTEAAAAARTEDTVEAEMEDVEDEEARPPWKLG